MLHGLIVTIHILTCIFLVIVVLTQSGASADLAAAFGAAGSQTAFGPRGAATVLTRVTTWLAVIFFVTSMMLSLASSNSGKTSTVFSNQPTQSQSSGPAKK